MANETTPTDNLRIENFSCFYEVEDMEQTVAGNADLMHLDFTRDVMKIMTDIRKEWGMTYPEEE